MFRSVVAAFSVVLGFAAVSGAQAPSTPSPQSPEVTANGRGEVRLPPDYAYVTIGVTTNSPSAVETASQNATRVAAITSALRAIGLTEQQITTAGYTLTQIYEYPKNKEPRVTGFTARNSIRADVRTLSDLGKVIDAAINAGATDVSSIQFLSTNIEQARRSALTEAVKQARMDADAMARAAGGALGKLITVNTTGVSQPVVFRGGGMDNVMLTSASSGGMPTPITPGDVAVIAMVFTRWEFVSSPAR